MKIRWPVILLLGAIVVAVVAFVVANPFADRAGAVSLRSTDPTALALGERVYRSHCAACHGAALEGQPNWRERGPDGLLPAPPHDASGHTWHHPDEVLFRITKFGVASAAGLGEYKTAMPKYDGVLSDEEIVAVLSWIKSRWPADVREVHDRMNAQHVGAGRR